MEKEYVQMKIENTNNKEVIKLEDTDDLYENSCGMGEEIIKPNIKKVINKKICYKCKINKSNYFNRNEFICKECFLKIINHKFRSNLRAHCKIKHEDYVLVCISGGSNSMSMLHSFYNTFNDNTSNRKLFFKLKVIYVDDSILLKICPNYQYSDEEILNERNSRKILVDQLCFKFGFSYEIVPLEESVQPICQNSIADQFISIYNKISKIGSFNEDFVKIITRNLIFKYALANNFNKIVFANTAQSLVNNTFNTIVKGRGFNLREDIGYIDSHFLNGKITVLKPMRDYLSKEILLFNYVYDVQLIYSSFDLIKEKATSKTNLPYNGNTGKLIKHFFDGLQDKMGSTITTVIGTAEKLKIKEKDNLKLCGFCLDYLDEVYNELEIGSIDSIKNDKIFSNSHADLCFGCKRMFQPLQDDVELLQNLSKFNSI